MDRNERFASNLQWLKSMEFSTRSLRQIAEMSDVDYGWLRRISTAGIKQESSRTIDSLKRLAKVLRVGEYRDLWESLKFDEDDVIECLKKKHPRQYHLLVAAYWGGFDRLSSRVSDWIDQQKCYMSAETAASLWAAWADEEFEIVNREKK